MICIVRTAKYLGQAARKQNEPFCHAAVKEEVRSLIRETGI
jgi:hypothetical protein